METTTGSGQGSPPPKAARADGLKAGEPGFRSSRRLEPQGRNHFGDLDNGADPSLGQGLRVREDWKPRD